MKTALKYYFKYVQKYYFITSLTESSSITPQEKRRMISQMRLRHLKYMTFAFHTNLMTLSDSKIST